MRSARVRRTVGVVVIAGAVGAGCAAMPASAAPVPVRVSAGVRTPTFTPFVDGVTDRAALRLRLDRRARVKLLVTDPAGRSVRTKYLGVRSAGLHRPTWDGRTAAGRLLPTGTYRIRFRAYKDGRRPVTSRTRTVRLQRQRVADRTATIVVDGDDFTYPNPPEGTLERVDVPGRSGPPSVVLSTDSTGGGVVAWWQALPPRSYGPAQVRVRVQLANIRVDGGTNVGLGYLVRRGAAAATWEDTELDTRAERPGVYAGPVTDVSYLRPGEPFTFRLALSAFATMDVVRSYVDVRYRGLVPA